MHLSFGSDWLKLIINCVDKGVDKSFGVDKDVDKGVDRGINERGEDII